MSLMRKVAKVVIQEGQEGPQGKLWSTVDCNDTDAVASLRTNLDAYYLQCGRMLDVGTHRME